MEIVRFERQHIEEARALAFANYCEERQAVADLLAKKRILYHTIALYEHDTEAIRAWFDNGFGHRCADAIRRVEEIGGIVSAEGITFEEISPQEAFLVRELRRRKRRRKNNCLYGAERQCGEFCDGAYCLPEYRGKNIFQNLLNYVILILSHEGSLYLGVDYESMNPTAYYFWRKYFKPYTCSVTRRIDGGEDRC